MSLREPWTQALATCPGRRPAHSWDWQEAVAEVYGYQARPTIMAGDGAAIPVPAFRLRHGLGRPRLTSMPFMFPAPPLATGESGQAAWAGHLVAQARAAGAWAELKTWHPLPAGCCADLGLTGGIVATASVLDLAADAGAQLRAYPANLRRNLLRLRNRSDRDSGVELREDSSPASLAAFHRCLAWMYRDKDGIPCQPWALFRNLGRRLTADDRLRLFSAWSGPDLVAGVVALREGPNAEYAWGATRPGAEGLGLTTVLLDRAITWAIGHGCRSFDFGCSGLADEGLLTFKRRWGCRQTPVWWYWCDRPGSPAGLRPDPRLQALYRRIPLWISRPLLGPVVKYYG